jgi:hypothetical protein
LIHFNTPYIYYKTPSAFAFPTAGDADRSKGHPDPTGKFSSSLFFPAFFYFIQPFLTLYPYYNAFFQKRGSTQKQEPAQEDAQGNKVNAAPPDDADLAEQPPVDPGLFSKIKDEPAITTSNKNRQQRQVEPQLFQNLPLKRTRQQAAAEEAVKKVGKKAAKEAVAGPEYMDYEDGLDDDALADAGELENEKEDVDYHPSSAKQQPQPYLFRNKQKQRLTNSKQQDGYGSADSTPPPKRYAKKKPKKNNRAIAAAAGSRKLALGGGHGATVSGVDDGATAMAGSDVADKPPSLADQVQYLLNHTAKLEERLSHQEKEIASLNTVALALSHTVRSMQQQEQQQQQQQRQQQQLQQPIANYNTTTTRGTNGGNFSNRNGTGNGNSFLPPPTQREVQIVQSIQKLDADNRACAASLNNHSKSIGTITQQVNTTNQNIRHLSNVAVQLKDAYRNLDHHVLTQKAGLAGCQNDIRDIKNFMYEYKTEMKKKVDEVAVKVAGAVRPSWDLSPRLL